MSAMVTAPPKRLMEPMVVPSRLLMGPGPSNCPPRVLAAGSLPILGHLHPEFTQIMDDVKAGLQYMFQTQNRLTLTVSGTGHAAMEAACCNMVEDGDVVLVAVNGIWGERFSDLAQRHGADVKQIKKQIGQVFTMEEFEKALKEHKPRLMFVTHGESSGATLQPLEGLGRLCHKHNCLLIVDSVAAMGGTPLFVDDWEIDVAYSGGQKVISAPPGASPITFNQAAWEKIQKRSKPVRSFYFDMNWLANYWGCDDQPRKYHHTNSISSVYAMREGIALIVEEGLETCWLRHSQCAKQLHRGLEEMGLELLVKDKDARLPTVTGVMVPEGVDWKNVAQFMMKKHSIEISGGLGELAGKIWRIGVMGHNATSKNVHLLLEAMKEALLQAKVSQDSPSK